MKLFIYGLIVFLVLTFLLMAGYIAYINSLEVYLLLFFLGVALGIVIGIGIMKILLD